MSVKKILVICLVLVGIVGIGLSGYFAYSMLFKKQESPPGVSTGIVLSIPAEIEESRFGFLSGSPEEAHQIIDYGGMWGRPHPGPFLWDAMQESNSSEISFTKTDEIVKGYQEQDIGLLITLWPFADWDQKQRDNAEEYAVSDDDEFLPRDDPFGPPDYLPKYRANPVDWAAYEEWVTAIVERYDGDGQNDMPGLKIPVKYWEVMNEPDLSLPDEFAGETGLKFYTQDGKSYAELLIKTSEYIKKADSGAQVLIAGAAGGDDRFLEFYRPVFENNDAVGAFDIANVHCISNDDYESFNVEPYKIFLESFGIDKPIWVTEAEAMVSTDSDINATQTLFSTRKALELGVKRIFYTRGKFIDQEGGKALDPKEGPVEITPEISGADPAEAYRIITGQE